MLKKIVTLVCLFAITAAAAPQLNVHATTQCAKHGHDEFTFVVADPSIPSSDIAWFKSTIESMVASGETFKAGENFLIGPVLLKIEKGKDKTLQLLEPDMKSMPFNYVNSVSGTLKILRRQRDSLASIAPKAAPQFALLHQPLLVSSDALQAETIIMIRDMSGGLGTGWVLMSGDGQSSEKEPTYRPMSVYEAMLARPEIGGFLAFPDGYSVALMDHNSFIVTKNGKTVEPISGSYLAALKKLP